MSASILITGAARGIGKGLVEAYLDQPDTTVIAGVRDVNHVSVSELSKLTVASGSKLIVVKIESSSETDAENAVAEMQSKHGITKLETVIANAGVGDSWDNVVDATPSQATRYFNINALGPMRLFHATLPLLSAATTPRFVVMSSALGSIEMQGTLKLPYVAYGMSKAAVNFFTCKVHHEHTNLIAFPFNPGWVQTELGNSAASKVGFGNAPVTLKDSVAGIVSQIEKSTREETSGKLLSYDGRTVPW